MKKIFALLTSMMMTLNLSADSIPHLILNFDVNKTLIASDKIENKTLEDVMNEMLSRKYSACWDDTILEPMTFDNYVRTIMMPGEEHDIKLKMARLVPLTHFIDFLAEHKHPLYPAVLADFNRIIETLEGAYIFPSFFHLIEQLDQRGITYTLFLRSFGREVFEVKNAINTQFDEFFQHEGMFRSGVLHVKGREPVDTPDEIYGFFSSKQNAAIHDDWHYWVEGEMHAEYGKPLYIDLKDQNTLTLFFDDNIKIDSFEKNIIGPINSSTGEPLSISTLLESKQMIFVDTIEAILNKNYFVEKIEEALGEHKKTWCEKESLAASL